jgi:N utilization substance protein A
VNQDFMLALEAIEKERGIKKETLYEAIEAALISAYKRNFNSAYNVRVNIEKETGEIKVFSCMDVVEKVVNPQQEIHLDKARQSNPLCKSGDILEVEVTPKNFGRIAAQTAKQVVIQRIREAEREMIYEEFVDREEDIVTGVIHRFEYKNAIINLGKAEAILAPAEQIPRENYKQGDRIKAFILEVKKTNKGPQIYISRTHPGLIRRLFELEVPELYNGIVEVKGVVREPGNRSKIAVYSRKKEVDPVGACVGPRGSRVQAIVNELKGEKIDIIEWNEEPEIFIASTLSPAKTIKVETHPENKSALVVVPDYQLSLAIGKEGQNVRLAAKLSGWKIDIISESSYLEKFRGNNSQEESGSTSTEETEGIIDEPVVEGGSDSDENTLKKEGM